MIHSCQGDDLEGAGGLPHGLGEIFSDPELMAAMKDPEVSAALMDIMQNPMNIMKYQGNQKVMKLIAKMQGLGGMMGGGMGGGMPPGGPPRGAGNPPPPTGAPEGPSASQPPPTTQSVASDAPPKPSAHNLDDLD